VALVIQARQGPAFNDVEARVILKMRIDGKVFTLPCIAIEVTFDGRTGIIGAIVIDVRIAESGIRLAIARI
jgi:hypothetical protein